ncbi:FHA domain-containing protein [Chondromyces crocatus]
MRSEVLTVARELEDAGEMERAAEAYAMAGDQEAEARALTAAGAIDKLEERLRVSLSEARSQRDRGAVLARIGDFDRVAERRAALEEAGRWLATNQDEQVADAARSIHARLLTGPVVDLDIGGTSRRYALGDELTIGRGDATIVIPSRAISRVHVRLRRNPRGDVELEDLGTRNGTTLAGARLSGPLIIHGEVRLVLGGEVPCRILPLEHDVCELELAGTSLIAPLGELSVGPWKLRYERAEPTSFVVLRTPPGAPPAFMGAYHLAAEVELCRGDTVGLARDGEPIVRVLAGTATANFGSGQARFQ